MTESQRPGPDEREAPDLVDPAAKTQPAEGGREEIDEDLERQASDEGSTRTRPDAER